MVLGGLEIITVGLEKSRPTECNRRLMTIASGPGVFGFGTFPGDMVSVVTSMVER